MNFFSTPSGYKPADSMTIALGTAIGVIAIYGSKVGPIADVSATHTGDPSINSAIKKAGWTSWLLVAGMTILSRDLNVAILGGAAVIGEHSMYLHAELANPGTGQIEVNPEAYQPAGISAGANVSLAAA